MRDLATLRITALRSKELQVHHDKVSSGLLRCVGCSQIKSCFPVPWGLERRCSAFANSPVGTIDRDKGAMI